MTPQSYAEYLLTAHWRTMRRLALEAADWRCSLCDNADILEVHHRTYERLGHEQLRDLVVLCEDCHARHHQVLDQAAANSDGATWVAYLEAELAAERAGAAFLARQVECAWLDGVKEGRRLEMAAQERVA